MEWLTQNWAYLLLLVGVILFMRLRGMGRGLGGGQTRDSDGSDRQASVGVEPPIDPVSKRPVDPKSAVTTLYQGSAYYFESRENRDRFESSPGTYAGATKEGQSEHGRHRHGGGCC